MAFRPCNVSWAPQEAECGTLAVPENPAQPGGRSLQLSILRLRASGTAPATGAVLYLPGGPGQAARDAASWMSQDFAGLRGEWDLVFVDPRGTGESAPLDCELFESGDPQSYLGDYFPLAGVERCRRELEPRADLTRYTSTYAADDLEAVRSALGSPKVTLVAGSYGTRTAIAYLRRYSAQVHAAVLHGVVPPFMSTPLPFARDTEDALSAWIAACAADKECAAATPALRADITALIARLDSAPVQAPLTLPDGKTTTVRFSRDLFGQTVRGLLYSPNRAVLIPALVRRAREGDFAPLAKLAYESRKDFASMGEGAFFSQTCTEDVWRIREEDVPGATAGTLLGDGRVRQQLRACKHWPRGELPTDFDAPLKESAPVLLVTGQWDPATPPRWAERAVGILPGAKSVTVPFAGHGLQESALQCVMQLMTGFIRQPSAKALDTSCLAKVQREPFKLTLDP
ncbi:alpha/beta hydrolase [Hyalangium rubrum]|uniref:Alpha/beta hydrolase n=1 Tax=Hyalangium rubrum TaxID=3103134 RepID=A0ABU5H357_9BACT|nr:alpha/beta hydrolase [Hyalangium sp. s54d21]MDY7227542.1 alpha/beta hydrolase [Hyalangium sp. s54d21]